MFKARNRSTIPCETLTGRGTVWLGLDLRQLSRNYSPGGSAYVTGECLDRILFRDRSTVDERFDRVCKARHQFGRARRLEALQGALGVAGKSPDSDHDLPSGKPYL